MKAVSLQTSDGFELSGHLFEPENPNGKIVVVNSATGVKQQIYFAFSEYLAQFGYTVITYDYRGIGKSKPEKLKGFQASMRVWGTQDFKAVTDYIQYHFPHYKKYAVGHSVGALILGMNKDSQKFEKFIFLGTQKAFVGHLNVQTKALAYLGFGVLQPVITRIFGYFPAQYFGLGESLPSGSAKDWRTLILNKKSTNKLLEKIPEEYSRTLNQEVLVIRAEDDTWLTDKGVKKLMSETYPEMKPEYRLMRTVESKKRTIGHINFFRSYNRDLWKVIADFIS